MKNRLITTREETRKNIVYLGSSEPWRAWKVIKNKTWRVDSGQNSWQEYEPLSIEYLTTRGWVIKTENEIKKAWPQLFK